jgi:hypothetical protein
MEVGQLVMIARTCHEANRAYCVALGDTSQPSWDDAPDWQRNSARRGVEFHLSHLERGIDPAPSASHDNWYLEKAQDGWRYGEVKDVEAKTHPCFLPYEELPLEQRQKDYIFGAIVKSFYASGILQS